MGTVSNSLRMSSLMDVWKFNGITSLLLYMIVVITFYAYSFDNGVAGIAVGVVIG
jgi:hypothetical protein